MNPNELKSAEEWMKRSPLVECIRKDGGQDYLVDVLSPAIIREIQLNAFKAGMTEAAEIASNKEVRFEGVMPLDGFETKKVIVHLILSARDRKESL